MEGKDTERKFYDNYETLTLLSQESQLCRVCSLSGLEENTYCLRIFLRNFKVAEAQCCKAVIMACQMDEDMTPLTAEQSKQKISKSEQFSAMGRKETQPFLDSISKVNPVPNITL